MPARFGQSKLYPPVCSGIFGAVNYLVQKYDAFFVIKLKDLC